MSIEMSQTFSTLNHSQMTKKLHIQYHTRLNVLNVLNVLLDTVFENDR